MGGRGYDEHNQKEKSKKYCRHMATAIKNEGNRMNKNENNANKLRKAQVKRTKT
jgi:hypothetical protein